MVTAISKSLVPASALIASMITLAAGTFWAKHSRFPLLGGQGTTALRVGMSAVLVLLLFRPWRRATASKSAVPVVGYGAALGAMNLCFYMSLQTIPLGVTVAIEFSGPLAVAILSSRNMIDFVWIALAAVGLGMLPPFADGAPLDAAGVLWAMAAAFFWAVYIIFGKRTAAASTAQTVSIGLAVAAVAVFPVGFLHSGAGLLTPWVLLVGLGVAILSSAISITLEMVALKRMPASTFGVMVRMEPAMAAVIALSLLGQQLSLTQWGAIALIMSALIGCAASGPYIVARFKFWADA